MAELPVWRLFLPAKLASGHPGLKSGAAILPQLFLASPASPGSVKAAIVAELLGTPD